MSQYHLIFRGKLLEGVSKEASIQQLSEALKIDAERVEQRYFGRWPVTVIRSDNLATVEKVQQLFLTAGLELELRKTAAPPDTPANPPGNSPRPPRWLGLAAGSLLTLLLIAGGVFWYTQPLWDHSESPLLQQAESALATTDLVMLAHLDVEHAAQVEKRFFGAEDPQALPGADSSGFLHDLLAAGVSPRESVQQVLIGSYVESDTLSTAGIVLGQFDPAAIRRFFQAHYSLQKSPQGSDYIYFSSVDESSCEAGAVTAAYITADRIVFAPQGQLEPLLQRLDRGAEAAVPLEAWRQFRRTRLASLGVFAPSSAARGATGIAGMMLAGAQADIAAIDAAYLGATASALPPGITLSAAISSADGEFLDRKESALSNGLKQLTSTLTERVPELAALMDNIALFRDGNQLGAELNMDRDFSDDIQRVVDAALTGLLSTGGMRPTANTGSAQERIKDDPQPFHEQFEASALVDYHSIPVNSGNATPSWVQGPFGMEVDEIGVDLDGQAYIALELEGRNLPNMGSDGQSVRLLVQDVLDDTGTSLIDNPACGPDKNREAAHLISALNSSYFQDGEQIPYQVRSGSKKLYLREGVTPEQVARIEGTVELDLPVQTGRQRIAAPIAGKRLEFAGARLAFGRVEGGHVSYRSSGDTQRILDIRALNDKGQVLATGGGSAFGPVLGGSRLHNARYQGTPDAVEVIFAEKIETLRYPFTIEGALPGRTDDVVIAPPPPTATSVELADSALNTPLAESAREYYSTPRGQTNAGPVSVALSQLQSGGMFGLLLQFDVRTPLTPGLDRNLAAATLRLSSVVDGAGEEVPLSVEHTFELQRPGYIFNDEWRYTEDYLQGDAGGQALEYKGQQPKSFKGSIELNLPLEITSHEIAPLRLGQSHPFGNGHLTATTLSASNLTLRFSETGNPIASLQVLNHEGQNIGRQVRISEHRDGGWRADLNITGNPARVVIQTVEASATRTYPFEVPVVN